MISIIPSPFPPFPSARGRLLAPRLKDEFDAEQLPEFPPLYREMVRASPSSHPHDMDGDDDEEEEEEDGGGDDGDDDDDDDTQVVIRSCRLCPWR